MLIYSEIAEMRDALEACTKKFTKKIIEGFDKTKSPHIFCEG